MRHVQRAVLPILKTDILPLKSKALLRTHSTVNKQRSDTRQWLRCSGVVNGLFLQSENTFPSGLAFRQFRSTMGLQLSCNPRIPLLCAALNVSVSPPEIEPINSFALVN